MMDYMKRTEDDVLTLSMKNIRVVKWWVDGSYDVHEDSKSQIGETMSLGQWSIYITSTNQKINTKSSTKTELVAADNLMPQLL